MGCSELDVVDLLDVGCITVITVASPQLAKTFEVTDTKAAISASLAPSQSLAS